MTALSRREQEVADLVAEDKTNREIAGERFVSDKTIEGHLANVFAKLGRIAQSLTHRRPAHRNRRV